MEEYVLPFCRVVLQVLMYVVLLDERREEGEQNYFRMGNELSKSAQKSASKHPFRRCRYV